MLVAHFILLLLSSGTLSAFARDVSDERVVPSESECRPYIEKALQGSGSQPTLPPDDETKEDEGPPLNPSSTPQESEEETPVPQAKDEGSGESGEEGDHLTGPTDDDQSVEDAPAGTQDEGSAESGEEDAGEEKAASKEGDSSGDPGEELSREDTPAEIKATPQESTEGGEENNSEEEDNPTTKDENSNEEQPETQAGRGDVGEEARTLSNDTTDSKPSQEESGEEIVADTDTESRETDSKAVSLEEQEGKSEETTEDTGKSIENETDEVTSAEEKENPLESQENTVTEDTKPTESSEDSNETNSTKIAQEDSVETQNVSTESQEHNETLETTSHESNETESIEQESNNAVDESSETVEAGGDETVQIESAESDEESIDSGKTAVTNETQPKNSTDNADSDPPISPIPSEAVDPSAPEEELTMLNEVPENLRPREHIFEILRLEDENQDVDKSLGKTIEKTLQDLKKLYDVAIKPLEILYKYRDLSNRHFGDPEIFSKPLILFMGPWSGGKSTIINYLLENEYKDTALRSGAEPSPAYFNIVMWGEEEEVLEGTQLAADWTFSGLQKFGQGLLDRLRGLRLNRPLLKKVNIVEIPGILEMRKQVERMFPFNDACQWFIDRADIIFLVYDPSKLDVGPETEAILDQLKGREMQTRIVLNKADQVKPEELMRVQGTLIWNISPLMSSTEPPVMYTVSLWSLPYEAGAPSRLLAAQESAFLKDLRDAIDKRVENKIASARRFAVRVRNHAKMVDCYLTTYYNHKSFFGNKKKISDDIIEHPQNYHIYEGLSTLTNISRYDLPDPEVYRDFFRLHPVYEFQPLASTCTYFRGCPINRLDVAIAYDLPELVGKYKKQVEEVMKPIKK